MNVLIADGLELIDRAELIGIALTYTAVAVLNYWKEIIIMESKKLLCWLFITI